MAGLVLGCTIFGVLARPEWWVRPCASQRRNLIRVLAHRPYWIVALIGVEVGSSLGLTIATLLVTIQNSCGPSELGPATSIAFFGRNLGGIMSITVVSAVVANTLPSILGPKMAPFIAQGVPPELIGALAK